MLVNAKTVDFVLLTMAMCYVTCPQPHYHNGLFQKKSTPPRWMGFWKFSWEGGQRPWKSRQQWGSNQKKSSAGDISTNSSGSESAEVSLSDPENSRNILFTNFSPNINDNLRVRSFGIFRNKNLFRSIFRNIFRLFCSWEQNSRNGNPGIPE